MPERRVGEPAGSTDHRRTVAVVVAFLIANCLVYVGFVYVVILWKHDTADNKAHTLCQQHILAQQNAALRASALFDRQASETTLQQNLAQQAYVHSLTPTTSVTDARQALRAYAKAIDFTVTAQRDQLRIGNAHPFPSAEEIAACA